MYTIITDNILIKQVINQKLYEINVVHKRLTAIVINKTKNTGQQIFSMLQYSIILWNIAII